MNDHRSNRRLGAYLLLPALALLLTGCPSTRRCPDGESFEWIDGGGWSHDCTTTPAYDAAVDAAPTDGGAMDAGPIDAGGMDGGPTDAGVDAGPCGTCTGDTLCHAESGQCVDCLIDDNCAGDANGERCHQTLHECVACATSADCTDPAAARCDTATGTCTACTADDGCEGLTGTLVCSSGTCQECTDADVSACSTTGLCTLGGSCSDHANDRITCESCDTDANCSDADTFCVPMNFQGEDRGGYCLKNLATGCANPFTVPSNGQTTLSGVEHLTFCGIDESVTTCPALRGLFEDDLCPGGDDSECLEGGLCRTVNGAANKCTYECGAFAARCAGLSCANGGTGVNYCGG